jgi:hypothetical protein
LILIFVRFARSGLVGLFPERAGDG